MSASERPASWALPRALHGSVSGRARRSSFAAEVEAAAPAKAEEIVRSDISVGEVIGKGRFKRVLAAEYRRLPSVVIRYAPECSTELSYIEQLSKKPGNEAYVPLVRGFCRSAQATLVVQELASFGSLKGALESHGDLSGAHLAFCAAYMAKAVAFLASVAFVHADLSCRNFLVFHLDQNDPAAAVIKVSDFGLAIVLKDGEESVCRAQPQATRWCAPETVAERMWSRKTDVWSLGCTIWEMFARGPSPWVKVQKRADVGDILRKLLAVARAPTEEAGEPIDIADHFPTPPECTDGTRTAMLSCLRPSAAARPSADQLRESLEEAAKDSLSWKGDKLHGATTPSTVDTPRPKELPGFEALKSFMASPEALTALGESNLRALARETAQACELLARASLGHLHLPLHDNADVGKFTSGLTETSGRWTVWWLLQPTVWRREFCSEAEARDVFASTTGCVMLQDPGGLEVDARDWPPVGRAIVAAGVPKAGVPHPDLRVPRLC